MIEPTQLHQLTLAEAQALLACINYRTDWTVQELIEAAQVLHLAERQLLPTALRIVAAAEHHEATELGGGR